MASRATINRRNASYIGAGVIPGQGGGVSPVDPDLIYAFTFNGVPFTFNNIDFTYGAP